MKDNDQQLLWETYIDGKKPEEDNILEEMDFNSVGRGLEVAIKTLIKSGITMAEIVSWPVRKLWVLADQAADERARVNRVMDAYGVDEEEANRMIAEYDRASREYTGGWRGKPALSDFIKR